MCLEEPSPFSLAALEEKKEKIGPLERSMSRELGNKVRLFGLANLDLPGSASGAKKELEEGEEKVERIRYDVKDSAKSGLQMWTRAPEWSQRFELGPVSSTQAVLH